MRHLPQDDEVKTMLVFMPCAANVGSRIKPSPRGLFATQKIFAHQRLQQPTIFALCGWNLPRQPPACGSRIRAGDFRSAGLKNACVFSSLSSGECRNNRAGYMSPPEYGSHRPKPHHKIKQKQHLGHIKSAQSATNFIAIAPTPHILLQALPLPVAAHQTRQRIRAPSANAPANAAAICAAG